MRKLVVLVINLFVWVSAALFSLAVFSQTAHAGLQVSTHWINFFQIPRDSCQGERSFEIKNTGTEDTPVTLNCLNDSFSGFDTRFYFDSSCPKVLKAGEICRVKVYFKGKEEGRYWGRFEILEKGNSGEREFVNLLAEIPQRASVGPFNPECNFIERCN